MTRASTADRKKKSIVKKPTVYSDDARLRKKPKYRSFKLHKRVKHPAGALPSWWGIHKKTIRLLIANKRQIGWFTLVYSLLFFVFVRGFTSPVNVDEIRAAFDSAATEEVSQLATNFTVFSLLLQSTSSAAGEISGLYQYIFIVLSSLALIWLFRQQQAGNTVTMKMAFYRGMFPLVPFVLVLVVILLQTIPANVGNFLFSTAVNSGLIINTLEQTVWILLFFSLLLLSAYLITASIIALFVVTLPEMTPRTALRKAKELVEFRRFSVLRKIVILGLLVMAIFVAVVFPLLFVNAALAQLVFFFLSVLTLPYAVAYLFVLYRELL